MRFPSVLALYPDLALAALCLGGSWSSIALAEELRVSDTVQPFSFAARSDYVILKRQNVLITGPGLTLGCEFAASETLAVGLAMSQAYSVNDSFAALYTDLQFELGWSLTGRQGGVVRTVIFDDAKVVQTKPVLPGGLQILVGFHQYFFNSSSGVFPFSGPGAGVAYTLPSSRSFTLGTSARAQWITNSKTAMTPVQLSLLARLSL